MTAIVDTVLQPGIPSPLEKRGEQMEIARIVPATLLDAAVYQPTSSKCEILQVPKKDVCQSIGEAGVGIAFITSVINGVVTPILFNPLDVVNQARVLENKRTFSILREKSFVELYRGLGVGIAGGVVKGTALLVSMHFFEKHTKAYSSSEDGLKMVSGFVGGVFEAVASSPIDNAKLYLRNHKGTNVVGFGKMLMSHANPISLLYKGFQGTCARNVLFNGVFQGSFAKTKSMIENQTVFPELASNQVTGGIVAGGISGILGITACYPISVTVLHQRHEKTKSLWQTAKRVFKEKGIAAFGKGLSMYAFRIGLGTAVFGGMIIPAAENIYRLTNQYFCSEVVVPDID